LRAADNRRRLRVRRLKYGAGRTAVFLAGSVRHAPSGIHPISILNQLARDYRPPNQSGGRLYFDNTTGVQHLKTRRHA
jgi:hypothetical protein